MRKRLLLLLPILAAALAAGAATDGGAATPRPGHATVACASCHRAGAAVAPSAQSSQARRCSTCHSDVTAAGNHGATDGDHCLNCHRFHEPQLVTTAFGTIDLKSAGDRSQAHCRSCHAAPGRLDALSAAHRTAAVLYHQEAKTLAAISPSEACLRCHDQASHSNWKTAAAGRQLTFNTHASHPYGIKVTPGKGNATNWIATEIDARVPLFDGKMECQSCHLLTVDQQDLLIPFASKYDLCRGCHAHDAGQNRSSPAVATTIAKR
jgi:hypothetical protein